MTLMEAIQTVGEWFCSLPERLLDLSMREKSVGEWLLLFFCTAWLIGTMIACLIVSLAPGTR
jgi:hypothetical protein